MNNPGSFRRPVAWPRVSGTTEAVESTNVHADTRNPGAQSGELDTHSRPSSPRPFRVYRCFGTFPVTFDQASSSQGNQCCTLRQRKVVAGEYEPLPFDSPSDNGTEVQMRSLRQFLGTLGTSIALTIALTFGLCIVLTIFWFAGGITPTLIHRLGVLILLAILTAYVYFECWFEARLSRRITVAAYFFHYLLACVTAIVYFHLLLKG
jgi:hypothetical protein